MVLRHAVDQQNRWAFICRANVNGERVAVRRVAGKLFQITGPATIKLIIPSVVLFLGTDSIPVPSDRRCRLPVSPSTGTSAPIRVDTCKLLSPACA